MRTPAEAEALTSPVLNDISAPFADLMGADSEEQLGGEDGVYLPTFPLLESAHDAKKQFANYRALVARTVDVFGDELKAVRWLSAPSADFAGKTPIQAAEDVRYTKAALEELFEPVFVHIEEGIYS